MNWCCPQQISSLQIGDLNIVDAVDFNSFGRVFFSIFLGFGGYLYSINYWKKIVWMLCGHMQVGYFLFVVNDVLFWHCVV